MRSFTPVSDPSSSLPLSFILWLPLVSAGCSLLQASVFSVNEGEESGNLGRECCPSAGEG